MLNVGILSGLFGFDGKVTHGLTSIVEQVLQGMRDAPEVIVELDRACAIDTALSVAEAGDCVLITGRGHQTHQSIGRQQVYFDDREVASMLLRGPSFDVDIRRAA